MESTLHVNRQKQLKVVANAILFYALLLGTKELCVHQFIEVLNGQLIGLFLKRMTYTETVQ